MIHPVSGLAGLLFPVALAALAACGASPPADPIPVHETFTMESAALGETRRLCVWLPPGYAEAEAEYPVLYMPDGGIGEDFPHIANTVAELVEARDLAPMLVVGIENTERRRDLTGPSEVAADAEIAPLTDGASRFRAFIAEELVPEIDRRYRVTGRRAIIGESAAGLFVVETLFLMPDLFERYLAMDPAIYWNDSALVRRAAERLPRLADRPRRFWFTTGDTPDIRPAVLGLAAELEKAAPPTLDWTFVDRPDETHTTIFRATKAEAMRAALWSEPR